MNDDIETMLRPIVEKMNADPARKKFEEDVLTKGTFEIDRLLVALRRVLADGTFAKNYLRILGKNLVRPYPREMLSEERVNEIVHDGISVLSNAELAYLVVNPHQILQLRDAIGDTMTPHWQKEVETARELAFREKGIEYVPVEQWKVSSKIVPVPEPIQQSTPTSMPIALGSNGCDNDSGNTEQVHEKSTSLILAESHLVSGDHKTIVGKQVTLEVSLFDAGTDKARLEIRFTHGPLTLIGAGRTAVATIGKQSTTMEDGALRVAIPGFTEDRLSGLLIQVEYTRVGVYSLKFDVTL